MSREGFLVVVLDCLCGESNVSRCKHPTDTDGTALAMVFIVVVVVIVSKNITLPF